MSRRADLPEHLRMECIYLLRGHASRQQAMKNRLRMSEAELKKYWAVENALAGLEPMLRKPVLEALVNRIAYEHFDVPCGRQTFYRHRHNLLLSVAREMGYIAK